MKLVQDKYSLKELTILKSKGYKIKSLFLLQFAIVMLLSTELRNY